MRHSLSHIQKAILSSFVLLTLSLPAFAVQGEGINWMSDIEAAKREAAQTGKLVLIHFWSDACPPCIYMEQNVFPDPNVAAAIHRNYVPVKIKVTDKPELAQDFGIDRWPADVVITANGQRLKRTFGGRPGNEYVAAMTETMNQWNTWLAQQTPQPNPQTIPAQPVSVGPEQSIVQQQDPRQNFGSFAPQNYDQNQNYGQQSSPQQFGADTEGSYYGQQNRNFQNQNQAMASQSPGQQMPAEQQVAPGNPPLGLDGYCPVSLTETEQWVPGNVRWGVRHRGRTYLFAGPEEQKRFFEDPDRYAPVASGHDLVLLIESGTEIDGQRQFGVWYQNRVYLFSSRETSETFAQSPERYVSAYSEVMR